MTLLPIVERELRAATRKRRTYWARVIAATAAVLYASLMLLGAGSWRAGLSAGETVFESLTWTAFCLCLMAGVFLTSNSLCEEKRAGTLALLFLTDLRGYDVVLGKLMAVSLNTLQMLLGLVPVMAICLALGGVSAGEFWRMVLVLVATLFFSLAAGMFVSAISRRLSQAMSGAFLVITLITAGLPIIDLSLLGELRRWAVDYFMPGPFQAFALVSDQRFALPPNTFLPSVAFTLALSAGFLALASRILPRVGLDDSRRFRISAWRERWQRRLAGGGEDQRRWRRRILRQNPVYWLSSRQRWKWLYLWAFICLALGVWLFCLTHFGYAGRRYSLLLFLCLTPALHVLLKMAIAAEAAERLSGSRSSGELELLLVTPISVEKICRGHFRALQRQFAFPVLVISLVDLLLILMGGGLIGGQDSENVFRFLWVWAMLIMLFIDAPALAWVGLWQGLHARNSLAALMRTLFRILLLPWVVFFLSLLISPSFLFFRFFSDLTDGWYLGAIIWWWVVGFAMNAIYCRNAIAHLHEEFRRLAVGRSFAKMEAAAAVRT
ncbi:MAG: ABC transporter permease [Chloroflexi bacterium]|nr:ABC transporter permease [Chloroflexota bacterium]